MDQATYRRLSPLVAQIRALQKAMEHSVSERNQEFARYESFRMFAGRYNELAKQALPFLHDVATVNTFDTDKMNNPSSLTWPVQKRLFDSVYTEVSMLLAALEAQFGVTEGKSIELKEFFDSALRRAVFGVPDTERQIQDVVEQLLIGRGYRKGADYDRETGRVKYSGREFIPDFIFLPANMFIEAKLVKTPERAKTIIEEINADILAYKTRYAKGMFIVYDLGIIRDVPEFVASIEQQMDISVCFIKH